MAEKSKTPAKKNAAPAQKAGKSEYYFDFQSGTRVRTRGNRLRFLWRHVTFKSVVVLLGAVTAVAFTANAVSLRAAEYLTGGLFVCAMVLLEMASRRRWETDMLSQLQRMTVDYDRIVREVARSRNELSLLKKNLSDAGNLATSYSRARATGGAAGVEQRMVKALAEQLSRLGQTYKGTEDVADENLVVEGIDDAALADARLLTDEQVLRIVRAAVRQDRIDVLLQPIVTLPQRKLRFYEMFSRIRIKPDIYLPAERYIEVAMRQDLLPVIDNLLLLRGLQLVRDAEDAGGGAAGPGGAFFCNITSLTLNDPKFMGDLVEFIAQNRTLAPRLIFEMGQRDLADVNPEVLPVFEGLSRLGCRFSMDQVRSLAFDFAELELRHIRFVKVDAATILTEMKAGGGLRRMKRMKAAMDGNGIDLIVEKIEGEEQLVNLLDLEIDYGQGYLLGKPVASEEAAAL
ncbi:MAG: EAL domain-containing protein [Alphaproteobacteria bacterium]|nr:EAL domain-containing protein [Alphaproteobacteria bacterium]